MKLRALPLFLFALAISSSLLGQNPPVFNSSDAASFAENAIVTVLDVNADDGDGGSDDVGITYSLASGGDNDLFSISALGEITFDASPDFETPGDAGGDNVYDITVTASDGIDTDTDQNITITVTDVDDNSPVWVTTSGQNVAENLTAVVSLSATDADAISTVTYTIVGGIDQGDFTITAGNNLEFQSAPDFEVPGDDDGDNVYLVTVRASDGTNNTDLIMSVTVTDADESPPTFVDATFYDFTGDGRIDEILVEMSEPIDESSVEAADFLIDGMAAAFTLSPGGTGNVDNSDDASTTDEFFTLEVDIATTADVSFEYDQNDAGNEVSDLVGNEAIDDNSIPTIDLASPVLVSAEIRDTDSDGLIDEVEYTFSEIVTDVDNDDIAEASEFGTITLPDGELSESTDRVDGDVTLSNDGTYSYLTISNIAEQLTENTAIGAFDVSGLNGFWEDSENQTNVGDGGEAKVDVALPIILSNLLDPNNNYLEVVFSEGLYTNAGGALSTGGGEFSLNFSQNAGTATNIVIDDYTQADDVTPTAAGDDVIHFQLSTTGIPNGNEEIQLEPTDGASVYDNGSPRNAMDAGQTTGNILVNLIDASDVPLFVNALPASDNSYIIIEYSIAVDDNASSSTDGNLEIRTTGGGGADPELRTGNFTQNSGGATDAIANNQSMTAADGTAQATGTVWRFTPSLAGGTPAGVETFDVYPRDGTEVYGTSTGIAQPATDIITVTLADQLGDDFDNAAATAYDIDGDGNIDEVEIVMPDGIDDNTITESNFTFNGIAADAASFDTGTTPNDDTFTITFTNYDGGTEVVGTLDYAAGTLRDDAAFFVYDDGLSPQGNLFISGSITPDDAAGPIVVSATTIDSDTDGKVDQVEVAFSETINDVAVMNSSFLVDGGGYAVSGFTVNASSITVDVDEIVGAGVYDTDVTFDVEIDPNIVDDTEGALNPDQTSTGVGEVASTDGAAPYGIVDYLGTTDDTPPITGTVDDINASILVNIGSQTVPATNNMDGTWSVADNTFTSLTPGSYEVTAILIDPFGNTGFDSSSGELDISAGVTITAPNFNECLGSGFATFDGPIIFNETSDDGISSSGTVTLLLPEGFEFNTSITPNGITLSDLNDIDTVTFSYPSDERLTINITMDASLFLDETDVIRIYDLEVRAVGTTDYTNAKMIRSGGTASISTNATEYADLSSDPIEPTLADVQESGGTNVTEWVARFIPTVVIPHGAITILGNGGFADNEMVTFSGGATGFVVPGSSTGAQVEIYTFSDVVAAGEIMTGADNDFAIVSTPTVGSGYLEPFGFTASATGTPAWRNAEAPNVNISTNATVTNTDLGITSPGVYSIDVYDYNGSCYNVPMRLKVLVYDDLGPDAFDGNTFEDRSFVSDNDPETLYLSQPAGTSATVTGAGTTVTNPGDTELEVTFDPSVVAAGGTTHVITYSISNTTTGDSFDVSVDFIVSDPSQTYLEIDLPTDVLGVDDLPITLTLDESDWGVGQTLSFNQFLYRGNTSNFYHYENTYAASGITEYVEVFDPRSTHFDVPFNSWNQNKPSTAGISGGHVEIPDGSGVGFVARRYLTNPTLETRQTLLVYGAPLVSLNNLSGEYCYNDLVFDLNREVTYASGFNGPIDDPAFSSAFDPIIENEEGLITNGYQLFEKSPAALIARAPGTLASNTYQTINTGVADNSIYMVDVYDAGGDGINFIDVQNRYFRLVDNNGDIVAQIGNEAFSEKTFYFETGAGPGQYAVPITVEMFTDNLGNELSFEIYEYDLHADFTAGGGNLQNDFNPSDLNQNGTSTEAEGESGTFRILYETQPLTPADIVGYSVHEVVVYPPATDPDLYVGHDPNWNGAPWYDNSDMNNGMSTIMMEFCSTSDMSFLVGDLTAGDYAYNWYWSDQTTLLQGNQGFIPVAIAFDDPATAPTEVPTPGTTTTFWFERIENGCVSPLRKIEVFIYDETDVPVPVSNGNVENVDGDGSRYVYEFCSSYNPITLNTLDPNLSVPNSENQNAYFNIYDDTQTYFGTISSSTLNATDFGGIAALNTTKTIYLSQVWNDASAMGGITWNDPTNPFYGCESELVQFDITVFTPPTAPNNGDIAAISMPEINICQGDAFPDLQLSNTGIAEYVLYEPGVGEVLRIESGGVLNVGDLEGSASTFQRNNVGVYDFLLSRVSNVGTETSFPGCESSTVNFTIEVHDTEMEVLEIEPSITIIDQNGGDDVFYEICISEHDPLATLDIISSYTPNAAKEFVWYQTDLNGNNEVLLFTTPGDAAGPTFDALGMGLSDVSNGSIRYYEVTQRTDIDDALDDYEGCEGPPVFIQVEFSDLSSLSVNMPSSSNLDLENTYCHDRSDFTMTLREGANPIDDVDIINYEVRLAGTSTIIDLDPGAGVTLATGTGNPTTDLDAWLVGGGGDADFIGGASATLDVYYEYQHPTLNCIGTHIESITIYPDPDITILINGQDIASFTPGVDDQFCYEEIGITLQGALVDGTPVTNGTFISSQLGGLTTANGAASFNPQNEHNDFHGVTGSDGKFLNQSTINITFNYTNPVSGCDNTVDVNLFVNPEPEFYDIERVTPLANTDLAFDNPTNLIRLSNFCNDGSAVDAEIQLVDPEGAINDLETDYSSYTFSWLVNGETPTDIGTDGLNNTIQFVPAASNLNFNITVTDPNGCQESFSETHRLRSLPNLEMTLNGFSMGGAFEFCSDEANPTIDLLDNNVDLASPGASIDPADVDSWTITSYNSSGTVGGVDNGSGVGTLPTAAELDLQTLHENAGGNAYATYGNAFRSVGGDTTYHEIEITYTDPIITYQGLGTSCQNTISKTLTVFPNPNVNFNIQLTGEEEASYDDYRQFCYQVGSSGNITLTGVEIFTNDTLELGSGQINQFFVEGDPVPTNNGRATINTAELLENQFNERDTFLVEYRYTDIKGCGHFYQKNIIINPLPQIEGTVVNNVVDGIQIANSCASSDVIVFVEMAQGLDVINYEFSWIVNGRDPVVQLGSNGGNFFTYPLAAGEVSPTFGVSVAYVPDGTVTTSCEAVSLSRQVTVGQEPIPKLSWVGMTAGHPQGTDFTFYQDNASLSNGEVDIVEFTIDGVLVYSASTFVQQATPYYNHDFTSSGQYEVTLRIRTSSGCDVTETRTVNILPNLTGFGFNNTYLEEFDAIDLTTPTDGWFRENRSLDGKVDNLQSSWRADANAPNLPAGSGNAVYTSYDQISSGEVSFVYSPSFDLSGYNSPTIGFLRYEDFESEKDGVVLQYTVDDGRTWQIAGSYLAELEEEGLASTPGWYNGNNIISVPGDDVIAGESASNPDAIGWASNSKIWEVARSPLPSVGSEYIRFRFAIASQAVVQKVETGFGFDQLEIYERDQIVLLELFSSSFNESSLQLMNSISTDAGFIGNDVLTINYFTDLESGDNNRIDPFNERSSKDANAKSTFYGIDRVPSLAIAGNANYVEDELPNLVVSKARLDNAKLNDPAFEVSVSATEANDALTIDADFTASRSFDNESEIGFFVAIVEPEITLNEVVGVMPAGTTLNNVLRKLLPNGAGKYVGRSVSVGETFQLDTTWVINGLMNPTALRVIAFAQDLNTKAIYQAASFDLPILELDNPLGLNDQLTDLELYPNPSNNQFTLDFGSQLIDEVKWVLYDQTGKEVLKGEAEKGIRSFSVNTEDIPSGMYLIQLLGQDRKKQSKRVIVVH